MTGRPSLYSQEHANDICEWLADGGSLRDWCRQDDKPSFGAVYRWLEEHESFRNEYARAREVQAHNDGDRVNAIIIALEEGSIAPDVARVMIDGLKWTAGKRAPKSYGDKMQLSGAEDGAPIMVTWAKPTE